MGSQQSQHEHDYTPQSGPGILLPPVMQHNAWKRMCSKCNSRYVTSELMLKSNNRLVKMIEISVKEGDSVVKRIIPENIKDLIEEMKSDLKEKYPETPWEVDLCLHLDLTTEKEYGVLYAHTHLCDTCAKEFGEVHFKQGGPYDSEKRENYIWETIVNDLTNYHD